MNINQGFFKSISKPDGRINKIIDSGFTQKAIEQLSDYKALAPVVILEGTVVAGRCYQAKKRGGEIEMKERLREETTTAAIWLFGVAAFNKLGDVVCKKLLGVDTSVSLDKNKLSAAYDGLSEAIRSPLKMISSGRPVSYETKLVGLKAFKIAASAATAVYLVGSVIPKLNQAITRKTLKDKNTPATPQATSAQNKVASFSNGTVDGFISRVQAKNADSQNTYTGGAAAVTAPMAAKQLKFGSALEMVGAVANNLENNNICRLLTVDTGVLGGRVMHARNKDERIEITFKDGASIPFYMFTTPMVVWGLSSKFDAGLGINTSLKPSVTKHVTSEMIKEIDRLTENGKKGLDFERFMSNIQGNSAYDDFIKKIDLNSKDTSYRINLNDVEGKMRSVGINDEAVLKFIKENAEEQAHLNTQKMLCGHTMEISNRLDEIAKHSKNANAKKLSEEFFSYSDEMFKKAAVGEKVTNYEVNLQSMTAKVKALNLGNAELDKSVNSALELLKPEKRFIVTAEVADILKGGMLNDPEFVGKAYKIAHPDVTDFKKVVGEKDLSAVRENVNKYVDRVVTGMSDAFAGKLTSKSITRDEAVSFLTGKKNLNSIARLGYVTAGLAFSAFFLSYAIPKMQYFITKLRTGKNEFPGLKGSDAPQDKKVKAKAA